MNLRLVYKSRLCYLFEFASVKHGMDKKVVVVGAGAAGIAAATKLVSNGFKNVTVLEAENRIGGRINTVPFGANVVDMGAQWSGITC